MNDLLIQKVLGIAAVAGFLSMSSTGEANLLTNASFESPGGDYTGNPATGWVGNNPGSPGYMWTSRAGIAPPDGVEWTYFGGNTAPYDGMGQAFGLVGTYTNGQPFDVSWASAKRFGGGPIGSYTLTIRASNSNTWNSAGAVTLASLALNDGTPATYFTRGAQFTLNGNPGTNSTLWFVMQSTGATAFLIDNVNLTIPEPSAAALVLLAGGLIAWRRKS